jgi:hypothetical protein
LAQAARLAGYSPQGARQRGSVLMADSDVRLRVEALRHAWMSERQGRVDRAIEQLDRIIDMAMELQRPTAALKAMDMQLKLTGVIRDSRAGLYADSPDDDLSKVFFDPREDEDPDFNPDSYPAPVPATAEDEDYIPELAEPDEPPELEEPASTPAESGRMMTFAASYPPSTSQASHSQASHRHPPRRRRFASLSCIPSPIASPGPASPGPMSRVER